jgi:tetratricopeptide (TPR) repeat protein
MITEGKSDRSPTAVAMRFLGVMLLALCLPVSAFAHIINRVEVQRAGNEAEIVIEFDTTIQYKNHSPLSEGSRLNINFVVTGIDPDATGTKVLEEPMLPKGDIFAGATFRYPEPDSSMLVTFPESTKFRVRQGGDSRSISIFVPISAATSAMLPPSAAETESMARGYLEKAKSALNRKEPAAAIEPLNLLLNLPPNASSQEAQELIGMAYEQSGENAKARTEYEFYVKNYPKGDGVARVNERLAKLVAIPAAAPTVRPERRQEDTGWQVTGGFGQTRYYGNSSTRLEPLRVIVCSQAQLDGTALVPEGEQCSQTANAEAVNPQSTARTDLSALVSSLDLMARSRSGSSDSRFVLRDVDTRYFLHGKSYRSDRNRLNAAYYENSDRELGYMMRLGRQTVSGGGVLGRFDGASGGYKVSEDLRLNGVLGSVVEFGSPYNKIFYGAGVDLLSLPENWSGNAFVIQQDVGSLTDRQAVGFEARYFDPKQNYFALVDYDTSFEALNIAMFQANWNADIGTTYNLSIDYRRSPVLMLSAASDATQMNLGTLVGTLGERTVREEIKRITPMMAMISAGLMHPLSEQWQLGGDFGVSNSGSTEGTQNLPVAQPAQKGTGNTFVYSARAIGSGLFFPSDMTVFSGSYIDAKKTSGLTTYSAQSYAVTHVARPFEGWQIDTSLRFYVQDKSDGEKLDRFNPSLRALYRLGNNLSFEAEINQEKETKKGGPTQSSSDTRRYYYAGYRWDL